MYSVPNEFKNYAVNHMGIPSLNLHYYDNLISSMYSNSLTPMVLEERETRVTQMSVFDRLLMDRIIWLAGPVNDRMSTVTQAQLMFLDMDNGKDITMHIDTPGGFVKSGLGIVDVMDYIKSDIITINTGMAASMGSILLGAGTKGKRFSLRFSKTMLHQSSGGYHGNIQDAKIDMIDWEKSNNLLFDLLGSYTNKDSEQVKMDATRDLWLTAQEAKEYGLIDDVIAKKRTK
jgi:ATP-dependent Clp protease protease subunit